MRTRNPKVVGDRKGRVWYGMTGHLDYYILQFLDNIAGDCGLITNNVQKDVEDPDWYDWSIHATEEEYEAFKILYELMDANKRK